MRSNVFTDAQWAVIRRLQQCICQLTNNPVPTPGAPSATVGTAAVVGAANTYMRSDAAPAINLAMVPTWTGLHTYGAGITVSAGSTTLTPLAGAGTRMVVANATGVLSTQAIPAGASGANPTGTAGLAAVNGAAATFMRSDAAPAISQAIAPTWTAKHIYNLTATATDSAIVVASAAPRVEIRNTGAAADAGRWAMEALPAGWRLAGLNDAGSAFAFAITVGRSGNTIPNMAFHTTSGQAVGITDTEISLSRPTTKITAALSLAVQVDATNAITVAPTNQTVISTFAVTNTTGAVTIDMSPASDPDNLGRVLTIVLVSPAGSEAVTYTFSEPILDNDNADIGTITGQQTVTVISSGVSWYRTN